MISTWPHLRAWALSGDPAFVADRDELELYLPTSTRAYLEHPWHLEDPVPPGGGRTMFPWLQLGPGILLARACGAGPLGVSLAWRLLAGLLIGGLSYVALRQVLRRPTVALGLSLWLLADLGLVFGKPLTYHLGALLGLWRGDEAYLSGWPKLHANWRLITPALSWPWLLGVAILWTRLALRPTPRRRALAGAALGLLVGVYFYHWTAAALGLALWFVLVPERRREALHLAWIAVAVGLPALIASSLLKAEAPPDWLLRSDKFVPIGRLAELAFPKAAWLLWALLTPWAARARRELLPLCCVAGAALALLDHQLLSGLQIENWHWQYTYGPLLSLLLALALGALWERRWPAGAPRALALGAGLVALLFFGSGLYLRDAGCRSALTEELNAALRDYRAHHAGQARGLVAGERTYVSLAAATEGARPLAGELLRFSPAISAAAWEERIGLDGALRGLSAGEFRVEQETYLESGFFKGFVGAFPGGREALLARRVRAFQRAAADLSGTCARLGVGEVALRRDQDAGHLPRGWRRVRRGPRWDLYVPPRRVTAEPR